MKLTLVINQITDFPFGIHKLIFILRMDEDLISKNLVFQNNKDKTTNNYGQKHSKLFL